MESWSCFQTSRWQRFTLSWFFPLHTADNRIIGLLLSRLPNLILGSMVLVRERELCYDPCCGYKTTLAVTGLRWTRSMPCAAYNSSSWVSFLYSQLISWELILYPLLRTIALTVNDLVTIFLLPANSFSVCERGINSGSPMNNAQERETKRPR